MGNQSRTSRMVALGLLVGALGILVSQCSDTTGPAPPARISLESGNFQYSLRGTTLPEPLVVRVETEDGTVPEEAYVVFAVVQGGGTVSNTSVPVDGRGRAETRYTLGQDVGKNVVRATIRDRSSAFVEFEETSASFYCPEQEDTFRAQLNYGPEHRVFLVTRKSSLYTTPNSGGVVEIDVGPPASTRGFVEIQGTLVFEANPFDVAFSARGELYVARRSIRAEILKITPSGEVTFFARLDETPPNAGYAEITTNPSGLLVGCDAKGPFVVGCRDSLTRFPEATFVNGGINDDAVAVDPRRQSEDPLGEDIYFIDKTTAELKRLAVDSLGVETRGLETVARLSQQEAEFARGMVCEPREGRVYILVDSKDTKEILEVTSDGTPTVLYDFFDRGEGDAAGTQSDLAFDGGYRWLYTLDTLNDNLLLYSINEDFLVPVFDDPDVQSTLSNRGTGGTLIDGERVGLVVIK